MSESTATRTLHLLLDVQRPGKMIPLRAATAGVNVTTAMQHAATERLERLLSGCVEALQRH
jgi:hypothetical protein